MTRILNSAVAMLSPGETLTAVLSGAITTTNPHFSVWWQDSNNPLANHRVGALTAATPVTIVAAPDPGATQRVVQSVRIFNSDSAAVTVTIAKVVTAGSFTLAKVSLQSGDTLIFDERGMLSIDSTGVAESVSSYPSEASSC